MSKNCAKCEKIVYPTEELKCLDKIWHKPCFKCKECGMALNMRNYKGFNKEPYCEAHIPKAKATTMAETPELRRIAANTKIQSNVTYHADFEASKGRFTQVADDPEMMRIKQNTKHISNVAYHGELQRKAEMEQRRQINDNGHGEPLPLPPVLVMHHHQQQHQQQQQQQHHDQKNANNAPPSYQPPPPATAVIGNPTSIGKISDYEPPVGPSAYTSRNSQTLIYSSDQGGIVNNPPQAHIGSVHDMDPVNHNYGSLGRVYRAMYDYEAQDEDEVSFIDGDLIINVSSIDGGWMTGQVKRTGQSGMLPANYVQVATI